MLCKMLYCMLTASVMPDQYRYQKKVLALSALHDAIARGAVLRSAAKQWRYGRGGSAERSVSTAGAPEHCHASLP